MDESIKKVEEEIDEVKAEIDEVKADIKKCADEYEKKLLYKNLGQLREEKKILREQQAGTPSITFLYTGLSYLFCFSYCCQFAMLSFSLVFLLVILHLYPFLAIRHFSYVRSEMCV